MKNIKISFLSILLCFSTNSYALISELCTAFGVLYTVINNNPTIKQQLFNQDGGLNIPAAYGLYSGITNYTSSLWAKLDTFLGRKAPNWWRSEENIQQEKETKLNNERDEFIKLRTNYVNLQNEKEKLEKDNKQKESEISFLASRLRETETQAAVISACRRKDAVVLKVEENAKTKIEELQKEISVLKINQELARYQQELEQYKKELDEYKKAYYVLYCALLTTAQQSRPQFQFATNSFFNTTWPQTNSKQNIFSKNNYNFNATSNPLYLNELSSHNLLTNSLD